MCQGYDSRIAPQLPLPFLLSSPQEICCFAGSRNASPPRTRKYLIEPLL